MSCNIFTFSLILIETLEDCGGVKMECDHLWPSSSSPTHHQSSRLYGHFMLQVSPIKETRAKLFSASNFYCQVISQMPLKNILINNLHKNLFLTFLLGLHVWKIYFWNGGGNISHNYSYKCPISISGNKMPTLQTYFCCEMSLRFRNYITDTLLSEIKG